MVDMVPAGTDYLKQSRTALRGLLFIAIIAVVYFARDFLLPVILAMFIALTLRPAVRYLAKRNIPPWLTATFFAALLITAAVLAGYILSGPIEAWINDSPKFTRAFAEKFGGVRSWLDTVANLSSKLQAPAAATSTTSAVQEVVVHQPPLPALLALITGYPVQFLVTLLATLVLAIFLMASGDLFYEKLVRILPTLTDRKLALHILYDIENEISTYVVTLSAINAGLAIAVGLTFQLLGMPSPYLWAVLIFIFNFIPYVGPLSGMALSAFMAIVSFDSLGYALLVPLSYISWSLVESEIVKPQILGHRLQMNAVAILLSLAFWTWLWGIAGAALAVPLLMTIKVFCEHLDGLSGFAEFLSVRHTEKNDADDAERGNGPTLVQQTSQEDAELSSQAFPPGSNVAG